MLPVVVFVRVNAKPEYEPLAQRWAASYRKHKPQTSHLLVVVNRYADAPNDALDDLDAIQIRYDGHGWDCGTWKFIAQARSFDALQICFNTSTFIKADGWLEKIMEAAQEHGDGLYGPLTSLEVAPHVRTPCMAFQPHVVNEYPQQVNSREDTYRFESMGYPDGTPNITLWARSRGYQTRLVTVDGNYPMEDWRKPDNIFRRGDQSNLLVWDRHCEAYQTSDKTGKEYLERLADKR